MSCHQNVQYEVALRAASLNIIQINFYKLIAHRFQIPGRKFNKHPVEIRKWLGRG
jgi:hypothetical protein